MARFVGAFLLLALCVGAAALPSAAQDGAAGRIYALPDRAAPAGLAADGSGAVWFVSKPLGAVGRLDPATGETDLIALGQGAQPNSLSLAPDGTLLATDAVADLVYQIRPDTRDVVRHPVEAEGRLELAAAALDDRGRLWFAGYGGWFGWLDPADGRSAAFQAPGGRGPAALARDGAGGLWMLSYKASTLTRIDPETARTEVFPLPEGQEGPKAVLAGRDGGVWLTAYRSGSLLRLDPSSRDWKAWRLPGDDPRPFAIAEDGRGGILVTDTASSRLLAFDPEAGAFREGFDLGERAMARSLLPASGGFFVAETGRDAIRFVQRDALKVTWSR
jgi:virginiamycin B lyase